MPIAIKIQSRASFREHLDLAVAQTQAMLKRLPEWDLLAEVLAQLTFMAKATAQDLDPTPAEQKKTNLGVLAMRHFEDSDPEYARILSELNYVFRRHHWLSRWEIVDGGRHGILQVWSGPQAFRKIVLAPGESCRVGSGDEAGFTLAGDKDLAPVHFEVYWDGLVGRILDRSGRGPMVINGEQDWRGELGNREMMTAGRTEFRFLVERWTPPDPDTAPAVNPGDGEIAAALDELTPAAGAGELYAVIDAAQSERAMTLLEESRDAYMSLYDGEKGRKLDVVAPYLVRLRSDLRLLELLVREGLGDSWGIYLVSSSEHLALRRHLRRFLKVELEGEERPVLFRFYDPRVLRSFLPIATPEQRDEFFGDETREFLGESASEEKPPCLMRWPVRVAQL